MLLYCLRRCRSIIFLPFFWKFVFKHVNLFSIMKSVRCCPFLFDELCGLYLWFPFFPILTFMSPPLTRTLYFGMLPIIIFTNPSARAGCDTRSIFKRSLTGFSSEFSFSSTSCLTKAEEPSLPYYLPIAGGMIIWFIPFPKVLVLCEMQSVSSRIWTRVAVMLRIREAMSSISSLTLVEL